MKIRTLIPALLLILLASCDSDKPAPKIDPGGTVAPMTEPVFRKEGELAFVTAAGETKIDIEIADTPEQRTMGLMYRKKMDKDKGMLFIFPKMDEQAFWMKNTYIPLDIIYVDDQMKIISIAENAKPHDETDIPSNGLSQYVVEVNAGFCKEHGIVKGDMIRYSPAI